MWFRNYLFSALWFILAPLDASCQLTITSPTARQQVKACEDLATTMYQDPWNMDNPRDINNFLPGDIAAIDRISFLHGIFSFRTVAAQQSTFYLFSPQIRGSTRVGGRWGQDLAIDSSVASKYRLLSMRMRSPSRILNGGPRVIFNRSVDYVPNRTVTHRVTAQAGWYVYRLDLPSASLSTTESSNLLPWNSGSITSLAIMPSSAANQDIDIDYIRLEDPSSCATATIQYSTPSSDSGAFVNLYLDDNTDLSDGYAKKILTASPAGASSSVTATLDGLDPGATYQVTGFVERDYAAIFRDNLWDMSDDIDVAVTTGLSATTFADGSLSGLTTSSEPTIYLDVPDSGIQASQFTHLSFSLNKSGNSAVQVFFSNSNNLMSGKTVLDPDGDGVYQVRLSDISGWQGLITSLIIRPATVPGEIISLDFVSLRGDTFVTSLSPPTVTSSPSAFTINNIPVISIQRPNEQGGESFRAWNMTPGDVGLQTNLRSDADPTHPGEPYTAFLQDVRYVDGVRGDFFKGTNLLGNDDPNFYLTFPFSPNSQIIDASRFRNLCTRIFVDHELDVCLGSIVKPVWLNQDGNFTDPVAAVGIYDRWSGSKWFEYCFDLTTLSPLEGQGPPWNGPIHGFRIDPHEFSRDTCSEEGIPTGTPTSTTFYVDWVRLTQDVTANTGKTTVVFEARDEDDDATINLFYSVEATGSKTTIVQGLPLSQRSYVWDTSAIPNGRYYIHAQVQDGLNSNLTTARGKLVIDNSVQISRAAPVLTLESPASGARSCDGLQIKGWSLIPDKRERISLIELLIDGVIHSYITPTLYSPAAVLSYSPATTESSNSGFNLILDTSSLSLGSHTLEVRSLSPDGITSSSGTLPFEKTSSDCTPLISDPAPRGSPQTLEPVASPTIPTATPTPPSPVQPPYINKARISSTGRLSLSIKETSNPTSSLCRLSIQVQIPGTERFKAIKTFRTTLPSLRLKASNLAVTKKSLSAVTVRALKICRQVGKLYSSPVKVRAPLRGRISSFSQLKRHLGQSLKQG